MGEYVPNAANTRRFLSLDETEDVELRKLLPNLGSNEGCWRALATFIQAASTNTQIYSQQHPADPRTVVGNDSSSTAACSSSLTDHIVVPSSSGVGSTGLVPQFSPTSISTVGDTVRTVALESSSNLSSVDSVIVLSPGSSVTTSLATLTSSVTSVDTNSLRRRQQLFSELADLTSAPTYSLQSLTEASATLSSYLPEVSPANSTLTQLSAASPLLSTYFAAYSTRPQTMVDNMDKNEDEAMDASSSPDSKHADGRTDDNGIRHVCAVCGDESDGLHFGQYTCRACAAFFRRTVSLRLEYTCKHNNVCAIEKNARNMCRSCRFRKCLAQAMQTSAVQHARDGIGKRRDSQKRPKQSISDSSTSLPTPQQTQLNLESPPSTNSSISTGTALNFGAAAEPKTYALPAYQATSAASNAVNGLANALYGYNQSTSGAYGAIGGSSQEQQTTILQLGQSLGVQQETVPYVMNNFANVNLQQLTQAAARTAFTPVREAEMKLLGRMLEGYHHFVSLRKASYTLIDDTPRLQKNGNLSQSNYGTSKKHCKIEASLLMDTVEKFYHPFGSLSQEDRYTIFDNFFCLFSNCERAFRSYKTFVAGDDRLIMPDGGYVRLKELAKFYENSPSIRGDPTQLAGIFENAMQYLVNVVVHHMRCLNVSETEIIALSGIMLWRDTLKDLSQETIEIVQSSREQIIRDLHSYYRSVGLYDAEVTLKVTNLMLLLPELEYALTIFKEDFNMAALFNMIDPCPGQAAKEAAAVAAGSSASTSTQLHTLHRPPTSGHTVLPESGK